MNDTEKKSFILYVNYLEFIEMLSNEQVGAVFRAVFHYQKTGAIAELDGMEKMLFTLIRQDLDHNNKAWADKIKGKSEQGKKGGRPEITQEIKAAICEDLQAGRTQKEIAEKYEIAQSTISNIKKEVFDTEYQKPATNIKNNEIIKKHNEYVNEYEYVNDNDNDIPPEFSGGENTEPFSTPVPDDTLDAAVMLATPETPETPETPNTTRTVSCECVDTAAHANQKPKPKLTCEPHLPTAPPDNQVLQDTTPEEPFNKNTHKPLPAISDQALTLAQLLYDLHRVLDSNFTTTQKHIEKWAKDIEKLHRIDKRSYEDIEKVIRWIKTEGNFWNSNIISGSKLREKYPQVFLQMQRSFSSAKNSTVNYTQQNFTADSLPDIFKTSRVAAVPDSESLLDGVVF